MDHPYEKKKRMSYTALFKRTVIKDADASSNRAAAKKHGVSECMVRSWKKDRVRLFKCGTQRRAFRGPKKGRFPALEEKLADFVREKRRNGLPVTADRIQTEAMRLAGGMNLTRQQFRASRGWVDLFMRREGFSLRRRTTICQKLPADFQDKLVSYQHYVISLRREFEYLLGQIGNADETPIWFDLPCNYTINDKGERQVSVRTTGNDKQRVTCMLAVTADGRKLPPFMIFKRKTIPKAKKGESYPPGVIIRAQEKGWMTETLMLDWLKNVWGNRPGALLQLPSMLVLDAFRGHLTEAVKNKIDELKSRLVVIPGGMTSVLQPLDVSINKPFKAAVRERYYKWMERDDLPRTPSGNIKRASPATVATWVKAAWDSMSAGIVAKSFKKCCLSNELDGSEDDALWQDDDDDEGQEDADPDDPEALQSGEDSGEEEADAESVNESDDDE